jgi:hypothetical protein
VLSGGDFTGVRGGGGWPATHSEWRRGDDTALTGEVWTALGHARLDGDLGRRRGSGGVVRSDTHGQKRSGGGFGHGWRWCAGKAAVG